MTKELKPSTLHVYNRVFNAVAAEFSLAKGIPQEQVNPEDLVHWVITKNDREPLSKRYNILTKSALLYRIENSRWSNKDKALELLREWNPQTESKLSPGNKRKRESKRMIPKEDWEALTGHLGSSQSFWANALNS